MFNAAEKDVEVTLPEGLASEWVVVVNGDSAGLGGLAIVKENTVSVNAGTALMLVDKESFDSAWVAFFEDGVDDGQQFVVELNSFLEVAFHCIAHHVGHLA